MSHDASVAVGMVRRGDRRRTRLLALLTVVIPTTVILNTGTVVGSDHWVEGRVLDASASVAPDPCPDLVAVVTGNPRSGPPTSEQVAGCLVCVEAEGSRPPVAGAPCAGANVTEDTPVLVVDGQGHFLADSSLRKGGCSTSGTLCVFSFSVRVPTADLLVLHTGRGCGVGDLRSTPPVTLANRSHHLIPQAVVLPGLLPCRVELKEGGPR